MAGELAAVYPMGVVERMTGLTRRQIRYYEAAGLLEPERTAGGHRLFCDREVRVLLRIRSLQASGLRTMDALVRAVRARGLGAQSPSIQSGRAHSDTATYFRRQQLMQDQASVFKPVTGTGTLTRTGTRSPSHGSLLQQHNERK